MIGHSARQSCAGVSGRPPYNQNAPKTQVQINPGGATTWTVPANCYWVDVVVIGGGGQAGNLINTTGYRGGGGGGGCAAYYGYAVTPGDVLPVYAGYGGSGTSSSQGGNGQNSHFNNAVVGGGGYGGLGAGTASGGGASGGSLYFGSTYLNWNGGSATCSGSTSLGGGGGAGPSANGGNNSGNATGTCQNAWTAGNGGFGVYRTARSTVYGGSGSGKVVIEYYTQ